MSEAFFALVTTTFLLLGTPGPVTLALAVTGATWGVHSGFRFLAGLLAGLVIAIICAMTGLAALLSAYPELRIVFQLIGGLYIVYLAYKIATATTSVTYAPDRAPGFKDGFILNLFNPKAYAAFMSLFSQFLLPHQSSLTSYALTGLTCFLMVTFINVSWLLFGGILQPVFAKPRQARIIRVLFAILMVAAVAWALI